MKQYKPPNRSSAEPWHISMSFFTTHWYIPLSSLETEKIWICVFVTCLIRGPKRRDCPSFSHWILVIGKPDNSDEEVVDRLSSSDLLFISKCTTLMRTLQVCCLSQVHRLNWRMNVSWERWGDQQVNFQCLATFRVFSTTDVVAPIRLLYIWYDQNSILNYKFLVIWNDNILMISLVKPSAREKGRRKFFGSDKMNCFPQYVRLSHITFEVSWEVDNSKTQNFADLRARTFGSRRTVFVSQTFSNFISSNENSKGNNRKNWRKKWKIESFSRVNKSFQMCRRRRLNCLWSIQCEAATDVFS